MWAMEVGEIQLALRIGKEQGEVGSYRVEECVFAIGKDLIGYAQGWVG